jgi:hypothetical protein
MLGETIEILLTRSHFILKLKARIDNVKFPVVDLISLRTISEAHLVRRTEEGDEYVLYVSWH